MLWYIIWLRCFTVMFSLVVLIQHLQSVYLFRMSSIWCVEHWQSTLRAL